MASLWELFVKVSGDNSSYKQSMRESNDVTNQFGQTFDTLDKKLGAALGFGAIGAGALAAANKFEDASVRIQRATGATGDKLDGLEKSFTNVYTQSAASAEKVSNTLALLSTRTQATGKDLEQLTLSTLSLAKVQGEDVGTIVPALTQMFATWSIATNNQAKAMDYLRVVSQQTGVPVSQLTQEVVAQAPMLKTLGYNWEQATALVANFDKTGVVAQGGLTALKTVLKTFAKEGVSDTADAWAKLVAGVQHGTVSFDAFMKIAGAKGGVALFDAIKNGRADVDGMAKSFDALAQKGSASAQTLHEKFTVWQHDVEAVVAKHYELIAAVGLGWPLVTALAGGLGSVFTGAIALVNTLTGSLVGETAAVATSTTATYGLGTAWTSMATTATGVTTGLTASLGLLVAKLGVVGIAIGAVAAGWIALQNLQKDFHPDSSKPQSVFTQPGFTFSGFGVTPTLPAPVQMPKVPAGSYAVPVPAPAPPPSPGAAVDFKGDFSALHLQDLQDELNKATKAFNELTAAGKLNDGQIKESQAYIDGLREKLALLRAGITEAPKSTSSLLAALGLDSKSEDQMRAYGTALEQIHAQMQSVAGPVSQEMTDKMTQALFNYAKARGEVAAEAEAKKLVPVDEIEQQNQQNAKLQQTIDLLSTLPPAYRDLGAGIVAVLNPVSQLNDALDYFGITGSASLSKAADTAKAKFDEMKVSGLATTSELEQAWLKYQLAVIEADHAMGVTDDELYQQRKQQAEGLLKIAQGDHVATQQATKDRYDLGKETEALAHRTFDSWEKGFSAMVIQGKFSLDSLKGLLQQFGTEGYSILLKTLFKPVEDRFASWVGKILGGASGAASGASNAAGGATSAAGAATSAVTSSLMGTLGAIGSIGSFITGAIGDIQNVHMSNLMGEIEVSTRSSLAELSNLRRDQWAQYGSIFDRMGEIWRDMRDGLARIAGGGTAASGAAASGGNTFNFYGADLPTITRQLKLAGVM